MRIEENGSGDKVFGIFSQVTHSRESEWICSPVDRYGLADADGQTPCEYGCETPKWPDEDKWNCCRYRGIPATTPFAQADPAARMQWLDHMRRMGQLVRERRGAARRMNRELALVLSQGSMRRVGGIVIRHGREDPHST